MNLFWQTDKTDAWWIFWTSLCRLNANNWNVNRRILLVITLVNNWKKMNKFPDQRLRIDHQLARVKYFSKVNRGELPVTGLYCCMPFSVVKIFSSINPLTRYQHMRELPATIRNRWVVLSYMTTRFVRNVGVIHWQGLA